MDKWSSDLIEILSPDASVLATATSIPMEQAN